MWVWLWLVLVGGCAPRIPIEAPPPATRGVQAVVVDPDDEGKPAELNLGRYHAVLFAAQNYEHFDPLDTPHEDVRKLGRVLAEQYGFDVQTVLDPTEDDIVDTLRSLHRELHDNDALLVYYAGHGFVDDVTKTGFWVPVDARRDTSSDWVSSERVAKVLASLPARHALLISDSCFSGIFLRRDASASIRGDTTSPSAARRLASERSRWVITSGGLEPVTDGGRNGMSVFAYALRLALVQAQSRYVIPDKLFPQIRERVQSNSEQLPQQGPLKNGYDEGGQLVMLNGSALDPVDVPAARLRHLDGPVGSDPFVAGAPRRRVATSTDEDLLVWASGPKHKSVSICSECTPVGVDVDGRIVLTRAGKLEFLDPVTQKTETLHLESEKAQVKAWSPRGGLSVAGTTVGLVPSGSGQQIVLGTVPDLVAAAFSPEGGHVVTVSKKGEVAVWNVTFAMRERQDTVELPDQVALAVGPGGRHVVMTSPSGLVWWTDSAPPRRVKLASPASVVAWSSSTSQFLTGHTDGSVRAWDTRGRIATEILAASGAEVTALAGSVGERLALVIRGGKLSEVGLP